MGAVGAADECLRLTLGRPDRTRDCRPQRAAPRPSSPPVTKLSAAAQGPRAERPQRVTQRWRSPFTTQHRVALSQRQHFGAVKISDVCLSFYSNVAIWYAMRDKDHLRGTTQPRQVSLSTCACTKS